MEESGRVGLTLTIEYEKLYSEEHLVKGEGVMERGSRTPGDRTFTGGTNGSTPFSVGLGADGDELIARLEAQLQEANVECDVWIQVVSTMSSLTKRLVGRRNSCTDENAGGMQ